MRSFLKLFGGYLQEIPLSHLIIRVGKGCKLVMGNSLAPLNQIIGLLLLSHYLYVGFVVANICGRLSPLPAARTHAQINFFGGIKMPKSFLNPGQFPICLTLLGFALSLEVQPTANSSILRSFFWESFLNLILKIVKHKGWTSSLSVLEPNAECFLSECYNQIEFAHLPTDFQQKSISVDLLE